MSGCQVLDPAFERSGRHGLDLPGWHLRERVPHRDPSDDLTGVDVLAQQLDTTPVRAEATMSASQ